MSFSFGFSGDDIEDEGEDDPQDQDGLAKKMSEHTLTGTAITTATMQSSHTVLPKRHRLEDLLASLPSQISYNTLRIPLDDSHTDEKSPSQTSRASNGLSVHRRAVFDIRTQLMAEADLDVEGEGGDNNEDAADPSATLLSGLENGDLTSGIYEGGFKTWECALDLASRAITPGPDLNLDFSTDDWEIVEMGAGSAVPSLALLRAALEKKDGGSLKFTLCDYNEDVLRLATAPNVLLNYLLTASKRSLGLDSQQVEGEEDENEDDGDLDLEALGPTFVEDAIHDLQSRNIHFDFISGGWGAPFLELFPDTQTQRQQSSNLLILASETIYSPSSINIFADTLLQLLQRHSHSGGRAKAWVAAKKVYFGVGGGVDEFVREIQSRGGLTRVLAETKDTGVGRVILEVTVPS